MPEGEVAWAQQACQGGTESIPGWPGEGLRGGDRRTDGAGPLRTGRDTGLNNSELLKRVARREVTASGFFRKVSKTLKRSLNPLHSIVLL